MYGLESWRREFGHGGDGEVEMRWADGVSVVVTTGWKTQALCSTQVKEMQSCHHQNHPTILLTALYIASNSHVPSLPQRRRAQPKHRDPRPVHLRGNTSHLLAPETKLVWRRRFAGQQTSSSFPICHGDQSRQTTPDLKPLPGTSHPGTNPPDLQCHSDHHTTVIICRTNGARASLQNLRALLLCDHHVQTCRLLPSGSRPESRFGHPHVSKHMLPCPNSESRLMRSLHTCI